MLFRKGVFPYEYLISPDVLHETSLPPKDQFYSTLTSSHISDEDFEYAQAVFLEGKCKNIKEYLELYLKSDVLLLAEVFENFRTTIFSNYSLDPAHFLTISSLAMQGALLRSGKEIELLREMDVITEFESNIRGGLTSVVQGKVTFNNKYLSTYDPQKSISTGIFLDKNALYATILNGKLPVGDFYELSQEDVAIFDIDAKDLNGDHCYALVIDFEIPYEVKLKTDDLPMSISQEVINIDQVSDFMKELIQVSGCNFNKHKSLIASHRSQEGYLISLNLLKLYTKLGLKYTKIHKVFRFKLEALFSDFIQTNISLTKDAKSPL